jgi:CHASE3 domain sensor protein
MSGQRTFLPVPDQRLRDWLPLLFGLFLVVLVGAMSARLVLMHRDHNADVVRSLELIRVAQEVDLHLTAATAYQRGFMLTGRQTFHNRYERSIGNLGTTLERLENLTSTDQSERALLPPVKQQVEARLAELAAVDKLIRAGEAQEAARRVFFALMQGRCNPTETRRSHRTGTTNPRTPP